MDSCWVLRATEIADVRFGYSANQKNETGRLDPVSEAPVMMRLHHSRRVLARRFVRS
jgi:hypothetical protein